MGLTDDQKRGYERTIIPGFQEDLTTIENVSIDSIEKILKARYVNDNIYTAVGPLLFSVNPYRCVYFVCVVYQHCWVTNLYPIFFG